MPTDQPMYPDTAAPAAGRPTSPDPHAARAQADVPASRRAFIRAGLGVLLLGGCATTRGPGRSLPSPAWDSTAARGGSGAGTVATSGSWSPAPAPPGPSTVPPVPGAMPRTAWALGTPVADRLLPLGAISHITIHHDALLCHAESEAGSREILERHRRYHVLDASHRWGDIGYHFIVDRRGVVWEGRSLRYQGAHVKNYNPGNVGIMLMGNFEQQRPSEAQLAGLRHTVSSLARAYRIPQRQVRTHREWPSATACPGLHLQRYVESARPAGHFA